MRRTIFTVLATLGALLCGVLIWLLLGAYSFAADEEHWGWTERLIEAARQRSISVRADEIEVPPLEDARLVSAGAKLYAEMCATCHMAPGAPANELRKGLYPKPPSLVEHVVEANKAFWVIKHGIKMTGMPAWGATHDDTEIWSLVAFIRKLPKMTPDDYRASTSTGSAGAQHGQDKGNNSGGHGH